MVRRARTAEAQQTSPKPVAARRLPQPTDRIAIGSRGLSVSPICVGLVDHLDTYSAAFDAGINFFFLTADLHWPLYERSRRSLERLLGRSRSMRDEVAVAVTVYAARAEFHGAAVEEVLAAVKGLGRIDLLVLGGVARSDLLEKHQIGVQWMDHGIHSVRAIGATFHERRAAVIGYNQRLVDLAFVRYNPRHPGARHDVFPHLAEGSPARLFNFKNVYGLPMGERWNALGLTDEYWRPHPSDYYRFALGDPKMDGTLCALSQPREVAELVDALGRGPLDDEEDQYLLDLAQLEAGAATLEPAPRRRSR
jgi:hypothetical protein